MRAGVLAIAACLCAALAHAQTSSQFEVAAITPEPTPRNYVRLQPAGQHFHVEGATGAVLIRYAYDVKDFQLAGGPDWIYDRNVQFKIEATFEGDPRIDRIRGMLRELLASRFQLKVHTDHREGQLFELSVARGGPRAVPSKQDNPARRGCLPYPAECTDVSMADFADYLSSVVLSQVVVDRTGVAGRYDLKVSWSPDNTQFRGNGGTGFFSGAGPSLFTALQEQAGLQLRPSKGPIPTLVVDTISSPTEN